MGEILLQGYEIEMPLHEEEEQKVIEFLDDVEHQFVGNSSLKFNSENALTALIVFFCSLWNLIRLSTT
jgi:hypothetical protein